MPEQKYQIIFATGNKGKIREIKEIVEERKAASGSHADGDSTAPGSHAGGNSAASGSHAGGDSTAPGSHADGNSAAPGSHADGDSAALGSHAGGDSAASGAREIEVLSMKEAGVPADPEETGKTFEENALIKAQAVYDLLLSRPAPEGTVRIVMSDDSGLEIDALGKAPGVLSARYMGYDTDYRLRMENLLQELRDVPEGKRTARFVAAVAAILPDGKSVVVRGTMEGRIGRKISGENGFGYDPFFYPDGYDITSADMSPEEKNSISHRGKALREMLSKLGLL